MNWKLALIPTLIILIAGGIYLYIVFERRNNPGVVSQPNPSQQLTSDELAVVRVHYPAHFEDASDIDNTTVWMKNGNTMPYYPYTGGTVHFNQRVGLIPPAQKLFIKKLVKQTAPPSEHNNIEHGSHQVFALFNLPNSDTLYATPIGMIQGQDEKYYSDLLFFYDDPHTIYDNWSKQTWADVDAHQVKAGMSELATRMSIGMNIHTSGETEGDRTVIYDVPGGKKYTITYVHNHATTIAIE
jgi:hypothetical protein